ncbi:MAG: glycosyltransferase family 2 protein [Alphaproteobacteria bacterium]
MDQAHGEWLRTPEGERARGDGVAVVIPCFRVAGQVLEVIDGIGDEVQAIYVVDDACPEGTGDLVERARRGGPVKVLRRETNGGVGAATLTGIRQAIDDGASIVVKIDGDGQMDPSLIPLFCQLVASGEADYAKGNRFYDPASLQAMPPVRVFGNAVLSFISKLSSGYWQIFDPTNGFVALHADVARRLPFDKISPRYFFESDMLFRLSLLRARVVDVPLPARYGAESSNLRIGRVILPFLAGHLRNFAKRIAYNYFLRDFSVASLELVAGLALLLFGLTFGTLHWGTQEGGASAGTVMLAGLPVMLGVQLLLAFIAHDVQSTPQVSLHPRLASNRTLGARARARRELALAR